MATLVTFHAHPDDEAISMAGTIARAVAEGHRVVLVTATRGEHGEVADGVLRPGELLRDRRVQELERAAEILGVARMEFLGYVDSGMIGSPENDAPESFWRADVEEAAQRLTAILLSESADVLTIYDAHGTYGHPDHMKVHLVGVRAGELAGTPKIYESVVDREEVNSMFERMHAMGVEMPADVDLATFGVPHELITTTVDVSAFVDQKRAVMAAHESQIPPDSFFLTLPDETFAEAFGREHFVLRGATPRSLETELI
ncbi:MAG: PIG-L family deacetylase [Actinomycetota bacterium]|nr:PIG-L family deacetylase [Actinomycetota bacterium]